MLSPDYPLLVDAENVSRSNDYHASYGFLQRIAHSHSRGCLRPVNLTGWTGHPALDLLSPHSHVLPRRAGKAAHRGRIWHPTADGCGGNLEDRTFRPDCKQKIN